MNGFHRLRMVSHRCQSSDHRCLPGDGAYLLRLPCENGDFQESCHSWAATQAASINGNSKGSSCSSVGLFIHTSAG
jgi:hypothetical protein